MTHTEALERLSRGEFGLAVLAEYRGGIAEERSFRGKDGRPQTMKGAVHNLEIGTEALQWSEMMDDRARVSDWKAPASKGDKVVVRLQLTPGKDRGLFRVRVVEIVNIEPERARGGSTPSTPSTKA